MVDSPHLGDLQQKFEENPRRYFAALANEYRKAGDLQRAVSICRIYLEREPANISGEVVLGQTLFELGVSEEAGRVLEYVLTLDPENIVALNILGDVAATQGDRAAAKSYFQRILSVDPRNYTVARKIEALESPVVETPAISETVAAPTEAAASKAEVVEAAMVFEGNAILDDAPAALAPVVEPTGTLLPETVADSAEDAGLAQELPRAAAPGASSDFARPQDEYSYLREASIKIEADAALREDKDEIHIPARTAEYSLSEMTAGDPELAEAAASAEPEVSPPPPEEAHELDTQVRTGEYSLAEQAEAYWTESKRKVEEEAAVGPESPQEAAADAGDEAGLEPGPSSPFITETVAELYLKQGFTGEALLVYRQLARLRPYDVRIRERIETLEREVFDDRVRQQKETAATEAAEAASGEISAQSFETAEAERPEVVHLQPQPIPTPPPQKPRQSVREFFETLGRVRPNRIERPTPQKHNARAVASIDDIRAATEMSAAFAQFGSPAPKKVDAPMPQAPPTQKEEPASEDDIKRFRAWLDGLSDS